MLWCHLNEALEYAKLIKGGKKLEQEKKEKKKGRGGVLEGGLKVVKVGIDQKLAWGYFWDNSHVLYLDRGFVTQFLHLSKLK